MQNKKIDLTIAVCMGTRPEIIKMAPVVHALQTEGFNTQIIHTGQHDSMAYPLYDFFNIPPQVEIALTRERNDLAHLNAQLLNQMGATLNKMQPDAILVHGDTSSALTGALAGFFGKIPVGHVEAGLRTGEMYDPFPEEKNRELIGRLASWHFAPTHIAYNNLCNEGINPASIHQVGNTVIDAVQYTGKHLRELPDQGLSWLPDALQPLHSFDRTKQKLLLITAHRRENWGTPIANIAMSVAQILKQDESINAVWPVHANPQVKDIVIQTLNKELQDTPQARSRLHLCDALTYPAFVWLLERSWIVMTDSGGIQEEASALSCPVLVLRETTERPELIKAGGGLLVGTNPKNIIKHISYFIEQPILLDNMRQANNPFGDGTSAHQISRIIANHFHSLSVE